MKVVVTGANGFLGHHVVRVLLARGYVVRAFVLDGTNLDNLVDLDCEIVKGNLLVEADMARALQGCDVVIHTAAVTDVWPTKNRLSWQINYELVKRLVSAIKDSSITKYVHVGTANSFGFGPLDRPGTETSPYQGDQYGLDYMDSKQAAQAFLLEAARLDHLPVTIINPTFMIGAGDAKPGTGEMILSVVDQKVPGYAAGGRSFAAVKDVAVACVNAIEQGQNGECYITGGTNLSYKSFFKLVAEIAGVRPPKRKVPYFLARVFAGLLEGIAKIRKTKPLLSIAMVRISKDGHYYASHKAIENLNYPQTDLIIALTEAIDWYDSNGYIKSRRDS